MLPMPRFFVAEDGAVNEVRRVRAASEEEGHPIVSIVMPCLNELISLPHCIAQAHQALEKIASEYGLPGEIVIADNGSTDGSQVLAESLGARVVPVSERGYGAALIGGCRGAHGRYLLMGDADGSYNFLEGVAMIGRLIEGADLCMGSRFKGGIAPGAMPWKNRYIGNPALTGLLNLFFRTGINDAHCGLRAITKHAFVACGLTASGMEFASEMVIKATLLEMRVDEVPATLSPDLRSRAPHLRPWRDGWRHLRYLLMLSPLWLFGLPALVMISAALVILGVASLYDLDVFSGVPFFGASWRIVAAFMLTAGHFSAILGLGAHLFGVREGYRGLHPLVRQFQHVLTLEHSLAFGIFAILAAVIVMAGIGIYWSTHGFAALPSTLPLLLACAAGVIGLQSILGGFLLAIISGNVTRFSHAEAKVRR